MVEIKPCPFCGGKNSTLVFEDNYSQVWCENHCINGDPTTADFPSIEVWNNRPIEDALQEKIEYLTDVEKAVAAALLEMGYLITISVKDEHVTHILVEPIDGRKKNGGNNRTKVEDN